MTNVYKLCSLPEPLTAVIEIFWTYLSFSFRFIVRTCDMKTFEEQKEQEPNNKKAKDYETLSSTSTACMHHDSTFATFESTE